MNENDVKQAPVFEVILKNMVIEGEVRDKLLLQIVECIDKLTQPVPSESALTECCLITVQSPSIVQRLDAEVNRMRADNVRLEAELKRLSELVGL